MKFETGNTVTLQIAVYSYLRCKTEKVVVHKQRRHSAPAYQSAILHIE